MTLTYKKKQYILNNYPKKTIQEIASFLKVEASVIQKYIEDKNIYVNTQSHNQDSSIFLKRINRIVYLILILVVFIIYFSGLNHSLVSDDIDVIVGLEKSIKSGEFIWQNPAMIIRNFQYYLAYQIGGLAPINYRFFNILFHIGFVLMSYIFVNKLTKEKYLSFFVALLVAVHPIMVESVIWISGGIYAQGAFFTMVTFYFYLLYRDNLNKRNLYLSLFFSVVAYSSSEKMIVFPIILLLYEFLFGNVKKSAKILFFFFFLAFLWGLVVLRGLSSRLDYLVLTNGLTERYTFNNSFVQIPAAITSYIGLFIWPEKLNLYQSDLNLNLINIVKNSIVTFLYGIVTFFSYKRSKMVFFFLCFFVISLLVTLNPFGLSWVFAERYAYFGSIGIYFIAVLFIVKLFNYLKIKSLAYVILTIIIISLSVRSIIRIDDWKNESTLWKATAKYAKTDSKAHNNLGHIYFKEGNLEEAAKSFYQAIQITPLYADPYHNLGNVYFALKQFDKAEPIYKRAIELNPNLWQSYQNLGAIYLNQEKFKEAEKNFKQVIAIKPDQIGPRIGLALISTKLGELQLAKKYLNDILAIDPNNKEALSLLSN